MQRVLDQVIDALMKCLKRSLPRWSLSKNELTGGPVQ